MGRERGEVKGVRWGREAVILRGKTRMTIETRATIIFGLVSGPRPHRLK